MGGERRVQVAPALALFDGADQRRRGALPDPAQERGLARVRLQVSGAARRVPRRSWRRGWSGSARAGPRAGRRRR